MNCVLSYGIGYEGKNIFCYCYIDDVVVKYDLLVK